MTPHVEAAPPAAVLQQPTTPGRTATGAPPVAPLAPPGPSVAAAQSAARADVVANSVGPRRGGAIGGVDVASSPALTSAAPSDTAVVSLPSTPPATAGGSAGPATVVVPSAGSTVLGNTSSNGATVVQAGDVNIVNQRPIVIVGGSGDTTVDVTLGGVVSTTITATSTNTSDGAATVSAGRTGVQTTVQTQTTAGVHVRSGGPIVVHGPAGTSTDSTVDANASTNTAVVSQSPNITVVESIPIVLVHPSGQVTIHAVIAGIVLTKVVGTGANRSNGQAVLATSGASGAGGNPLVTLDGNTSTNTVVIVQTPTITVTFVIPITIIDPQGPVQVQAVIAGEVDTQLTATGTNTSAGTAAAVGSPGEIVAMPDGSTSSIVIVQAPQVTLDQQIPITITDPASTVAVDALIGSTVTTTLDATAVNTSTGTVLSGDATHPVATTASAGNGAVQLIQAPTITVHSAIPITITDPATAPSVHATVADVVRTAVRQHLAASPTTSPPPAPTPVAVVLMQNASTGSFIPQIRSPWSAPSPQLPELATTGTSPLPPTLLAIAAIAGGLVMRRRRRA